jgi:alpha-L-fucosidase
MSQWILTEKENDMQKTMMMTLAAAGMLAITALLPWAAVAVATDAAIPPSSHVEEKRLPDGNSELRILDATGNVLKTAVVNLSKHHYPATSPDAPLVKKFQSWRYGALLSYNSNQFCGEEHCTILDSKRYAPSHLDVPQWIQTLKAAGMKYAVLTTSHTSGFLLWDSPTTGFDVANGSDKTDVVQAFVEECRRQDIVPGLYYCMWGGEKFSAAKRKRAESRTDSPRAIILYQLQELATRYGKVPYFWIDMMNWATADLKPQEVYDLLKNINPDCVVILNQHVQDGTKINYFPTDVINGEMRSPPAVGHNPVRTVGGTKYYFPFEYEAASQNRGKHTGNWDYPDVCWFTYGDGKGFEPSKPFGPKFLFNFIKRAYGRGASNVLLSCAPDHTGRFRDEDVKQLTELRRMIDNLSTPVSLGKPAKASSVWQQRGYEPGNAVDGNPDTRWGAVKDAKSAWLELDLGQPATFGRAVIVEAYAHLKRIQKFQIEYRQDGKWKPCYSG